MAALVLQRFRSHGFTVEPVWRDDAVEAVCRFALLGTERPDALLLAPEHGTRDFASQTEGAYSLAERIRGLNDNLVFPGRVRAKTLPIVLAAYGTDVLFYHSDRDTPPSLHWFRVCRSNRSLLEEVKTAIREWRRSLLDQLDLVGYAITRDDAGFFQVGQAFIRRFRETDFLAVGASPKTLRDADYYIVPNDILEDAQAFIDLEELLNNYRVVAKARRVKPETVFQEFFEAYPHMMLRGDFGSLHPKPRLPRPEAPGRFFAPDFLQGPRLLSAQRRWGVAELKLPDVPLLEHQRAFHRGFSQKVHKAINQLVDYREVIDRRDSAVMEALRRQVGGVPDNPRLAVIIGRRPKAKEDLRDLHHRMRTMLEPLDVDVITYDDVLETEQRRLILQFTLGTDP